MSTKTDEKVHARMNLAWRDTVTIERLSTGDRLDISVADARTLAADLLSAADAVEEADR
ncbi:hypothetical protein GCM10022234_00450 [Aeromicrobium panaciterrae]|uniref:hypothetical protein n=1 Tax=Aeromicrobium panaciterrae TaxID=363861 RepID=UPI0031E2F956